jgi:hypothetical protein
MTTEQVSEEESPSQLLFKFCESAPRNGRVQPD